VILPQRIRAEKRPPLRQAVQGFSLFCHQGSGYWVKKVRGKLEYFGKRPDDPKGEAALLLWLKHKENLLAGRKRREDGEGVHR
jgi:hypothetical protein